MVQTMGTVNPTLYLLVFPLSRFFFQRIGDLLEQEQIIFGNIVNIALENSTNLWNYDIWCALILDWYKI